LNGYSAAGKTGTAQKIDVVTHTYSHTKLVASFAGFAPVSNPAIAVVVVMDTPQGSDAQRYGGAASAPVFAQVAQEVLEYLGVPHDEPLKTQKELLAEASKDGFETASEQSPEELTAMFADINDLPADDPLRKPAGAAPEVASSQPAPHVGSGKGVLDLLPDKVVKAFQANGGTSSVMPYAAQGATAKLDTPKIQPVLEHRDGGVVVDSGKRVPVPAFEGQGLREVVEKAESTGLRVKLLGSGIAREQYPAGGTMVPAGTEIVVRFLR
jgi:cell division protein FtsI (penicillin-binding protein 3)